MSDIFFDKETHTYLVDGEKVPSVTDILAPLHRSYGTISPAVLEYAAARGTAVHEACEAIDLDLEPDIEYDTEGYIMAYLKFRQTYRPDWTAIEEIVYDDTSDYIGTLDRAGLVDGEFAVVDIKTSSPTKEALVSVCVQTHAYATAYSMSREDAPDKIRRYGLFLNKDGTFRFLDCEEYEEKYSFSAKNVWNELLICHRMITIVLKTGGAR